MKLNWKLIVLLSAAVVISCQLEEADAKIEESVFVREDSGISRGFIYDYCIHYHLNGGIVNQEDRFNEPTTDKVFTCPATSEFNVMLLDKNKVSRSGFIFCGWYLDEHFSALSLKRGFSEKTVTSGVVDVWALWGICVSASEAPQRIAQLSKGCFSVQIVGDMTECQLRGIVLAIRNLDNVSIRLDLSKASGVFSISSSTFFACKSMFSLILPYYIEKITNPTFCCLPQLEEIFLPEVSKEAITIGVYGCINYEKNLPKLHYSKCTWPLFPENERRIEGGFFSRSENG